MGRLNNTNVGGFSKSRLTRITEAMQVYVERGDVPGVVTRIFRHGELAHQDKVGWFDLETKQTPMQDDTLFRIASMTKPIIAVAVLSLVEEARLRWMNQSRNGCLNLPTVKSWSTQKDPWTGKSIPLPDPLH
jgi:CubicO group peptidase (beta-lactamase class C family)